MSSIDLGGGPVETGPPPRSLARRLTFAVILVLAFGALAVALAAFAYGRRAAEQTYDRLLIGAANQIAEAVRIRDGAVAVDLPVSAFQLLALAPRDRILYGVFGPDGQTVTGYPVARPRPDARSFFTGVFGGETARFAVVRRTFAERDFEGTVTVSVGQTLAAKRRERIRPDQELIGLGAANLASSISGGFPVTGGFARSVVNFEAGAETPAAGIFTAIGIAVATLTLTPFLFYLPKAVLAATIVVAVLSLVDLSILRRAWAYSRADFAAVATTIVLTLLVGVEAGVSAGVALSVLLFLWRTSRPHIAEVGRVPGTEHFRNVLRHRVETDPSILTVRVDESLYFANARFLEDYVLESVACHPEVRHVILLCSAINDIDLSALESLEAIDQRLTSMGVALHLSEVKGPVTDKLARTAFLSHLSGRLFLSQHEAMAALAPEGAPPTRQAG